MGKRQAFRLAPVLRVRQATERAAAMAHAEAERAATEAWQRAEDAVAALRERTVRGSHSADSFLAAMVASAAAAADVTAARSSAQASTEHAALLRERWTAATQENKALEKLRERHELALRQAEDAAESRAIDDLVTGRHASRVAGAAPYDTHGEEEQWTG